MLAGVRCAGVRAGSDLHTDVSGECRYKTAECKCEWYERSHYTDECKNPENYENYNKDNEYKLCLLYTSPSPRDS